jgi:glycerol-3-phosphate acyltransferase PlsY
MSAVAALLAVVIPAYLLGALPFGLWVARLLGVDLLRRGSGNLGATNVYRTLGAKAGILVLVLDALKGGLAVVWARAVPSAEAAGIAAAFPGGEPAAAVAAGLAAIVGHVLTPFAGFRGGRGVATTIGVFLALAPLAMALGLAAFVAAYALTQRVSVGSLALAAVYPIGLLLTARGPGRNGLLALGAAASILIVIRHLPNISRLLRGEEPKTPLRRRTGAGDVESPRSGGTA